MKVPRTGMVARHNRVRRLLGILVFCSTVHVVRATSTDQVTPDQVINKVQERYNAAKTLSVHFVETYRILGRARPQEAGSLVLKKQGKMRWDYSRPAGKLFISDGKTVFLYTAADNRVEKIPMKETSDMRAPLAFLLGKLDMRKEFRDFSVRSDERGIWLDATAKSDRVPYKLVRMLVGSDAAIQELTVSGRDESILSFVFTDEKLNPPVADSLFRFAIPPGAEVIDAVELRSEAEK